MVINIIQFAINSLGHKIITPTRVIRGWSDNADRLQVISPEPIDTVVTATVTFKDGRYPTFTIVLLATAQSGKDVIDPTHTRYEEMKDWRVWEINIPEACTTKITRYRGSVVGISLAFSDANAKARYVTTNEDVSVDPNTFGTAETDFTEDQVAEILTEFQVQVTRNAEDIEGLREDVDELIENGEGFRFISKGVLG